MLSWFAGGSSTSATDNAVSPISQMTDSACIATLSTSKNIEQESKPISVTVTPTDPEKAVESQKTETQQLKSKKNMKLENLDNINQELHKQGPESDSMETCAKPPLSSSSTEQKSKMQRSSTTKKRNSPKKKARTVKKKNDRHNLDDKKVNQTTTTTATYTSEHETDVHAGCKKTIATLYQEIRHWKSTVELIAKETQANNTLTFELKVAAIRALCDTAEEKSNTMSKCSDKEDSSKKPFKRGRRTKNHLSKQDVAIDTIPAPASTLAPMSTHLAQRQQRRLLQSVPRRMMPTHSQFHYSNRVLKSVLSGQHYSQGSDFRMNSLSRMGGGRPLPQWNQATVPRGFNHNTEGIPPQRSRFNAGHVANRSPQHHAQSFNQTNRPRLETFNAQILTNQRSSNNQQLPFMASAAESDHPVCIHIREQLRQASDVDSITRLIQHAETHKIQDLVDRARRKLAKLQSQK